MDRDRCVERRPQSIGGEWQRVAAQRFVFLRLFVRFDYDDAKRSDEAPFCSHAVCSAYRLGGQVDPVPRKPDHLVTPNDLTFSVLGIVAVVLQCWFEGTGCWAMVSLVQGIRLVALKSGQEPTP